MGLRFVHACRAGHTNLGRDFGMVTSMSIPRPPCILPDTTTRPSGSRRVFIAWPSPKEGDVRFVMELPCLFAIDGVSESDMEGACLNIDSDSAACAHKETTAIATAAPRRLRLKDDIGSPYDLRAVNRSPVTRVKGEVLRSHHPILVFLQDANPIKLLAPLRRHAAQMRHTLGEFPTIDPNRIVGSNFDRISWHPAQVFAHQRASLMIGADCAEV